jgi:hypothetical protein
MKGIINCSSFQVMKGFLNILIPGLTMVFGEKVFNTLDRIKLNLILNKLYTL